MKQKLTEYYQVRLNEKDHHNNVHKYSKSVTVYCF